MPVMNGWSLPRECAASPATYWLRIRGVHIGRMRNLRSSLLTAVLVVSSATLRAQSPGKFYLGADVSALAAVRGEPFVYRENGKVSTEYDIMVAHGWNAFRLRVFVSP